MKHLPYLLPLGVLVLKRHAAAALLLDLAGHPQRYQVVALGTWSLVTVGVVGALLCVAVLVVNWLMFEAPANRRKKARP